MKSIHTAGFRKSAVARATLTPGNGIIRVNSSMLDFFQPAIYREKVQEPLRLAGDVAKKVDISVKVFGGGVASQAEAVRLAIARALAEFDANLQNTFLDYDRTLLVADVRRKETRKPNRQGKARSKKPKGKR